MQGSMDTSFIKTMNKTFSMLVLLMLAMFTFTACSNDDDDNDNDGQNDKKIEALMTTPPTSFGWSGDSINGVLYYYPEQNVSEARQRLLTRASDDDYDDDDYDDDDDDVNVQIFCAYHMSGGKVADAIGCWRFEDKATAKLYYDMIKSGAFFDDDDDGDDDDDYTTMVEQSLFQVLKENVKISDDGQTVYFPQNNIPSDFSKSELAKCVQVWMAIIGDGSELAGDYDLTHFVGSDDELLFGGTIDDNGNYQSNTLNDKDNLTYCSIVGLEKVSITKLSASSMRVTLQFSSTEYARGFYSHSILDGDAPEDHPDDTLSGTTINEVVTWYDFNRAIRIADIRYNMPLFFFMGFDY